METSFFKNGKWVVTPSGIWNRDNQLGRDMAAEVLSVLSRDQVPAMLWFIVDAMPRHETFKGIAVGFFHGIATMAISGYEIDTGIAESRWR